jgi:hypothetical protein
MFVFDFVGYRHSNEMLWIQSQRVQYLSENFSEIRYNEFGFIEQQCQSEC